MHARAVLAGLAVSLVATATTRAAGTYTVNVYDCHRVSSPPRLDGRLDDPCWQRLPAMDVFYEYRGYPIDRVVVSSLKTVARLGWDDRSLYMGIVLYDDMAKVRARVGNRDDVDIWRDDCVEIYFDPDSAGRFFYKLSTNSIGTRLDFTGPIRNSAWNPPWRVACTRSTDHWTIETRVPWVSFHRTPAPGDLWAFDLVRFSHTTGRLRGSNWTPKAAQGRPGLYGYLHFGRTLGSGLRNLVRTASATKGGSWQMPMAGGWLTYTDDRTALVASLREAVEAMGYLDALIEVVPQPELPKPLVEERRKLAGCLRDLRRRAVEANTGAKRRHVAEALGALARSARDLHWRIAEQQLLSRLNR